MSTPTACKPGDFRSLAANMIELIEDGQERKQIAEAGYHRTRQFGWDKSTDMLEKLFEGVR